MSLGAKLANIFVICKYLYNYFNIKVKVFLILYKMLHKIAFLCIYNQLLSGIFGGSGNYTAL